MRADRLLRLAEHLENGRPGGHRRFDFALAHEGTATEKHCGSVGCALGDCLAIWPEDSRVREWFVGGVPIRQVRSERAYYATAYPHCVTRAANFFEISKDDAGGLFLPEAARWWRPGRLSDRATAKRVAASIRAYVKVVAYQESLCK